MTAGSPGVLRAAHDVAFHDYPHHAPMDAETWEGFMVRAGHVRDDLSWWWRDTRTGGVAAYLFLHEYAAPVSGRWGARDGHVPYLGTRPEHRGRGLGGLLLQHALRACRHAGYDTVSLEVDAANPTGAVGMYERAGFRTAARFDELMLRE